MLTSASLPILGKAQLASASGSLTDSPSRRRAAIGMSSTSLALGQPFDPKTSYMKVPTWSSTSDLMQSKKEVPLAALLSGSYLDTGIGGDDSSGASPVVPSPKRKSHKGHGHGGEKAGKSLKAFRCPFEAGGVGSLSSLSEGRRSCWTPPIGGGVRGTKDHFRRQWMPHNDFIREVAIQGASNTQLHDLKVLHNASIRKRDAGRRIDAEESLPPITDVKPQAQRGDGGAISDSVKQIQNLIKVLEENESIGRPVVKQAQVPQVTSFAADALRGLFGGSAAVASGSEDTKVEPLEQQPPESYPSSPLGLIRWLLDEYGTCASAFERLDRRHFGKISKHDFIRSVLELGFLSKANSHERQRCVEKAFFTLDRDQDGALIMEDLEQLVPSVPICQNRTSLAEIGGDCPIADSIRDREGHTPRQSIARSMVFSEQADKRHEQIVRQRKNALNSMAPTSRRSGILTITEKKQREHENPFASLKEKYKQFQDHWHSGGPQPGRLHLDSYT